MWTFIDSTSIASLLTFLNTFGTATGSNMAAKMLSDVLGPVGGALLAMSFIFMIFEEDLVDGVRKFLTSIITIGCIYGVLQNWGAAMQAADDIQTGVVTVATASISGGISINPNNPASSVLSEFTNIAGQFSEALAKNSVTNIMNAVNNEASK